MSAIVEVMPAPTNITELSREQLLEIVLLLQQQVEQLTAENERLKKGGKRQANPFSKGTHKPNPKTSGRKKGKGEFLQRNAPTEAEITKNIHVPVDETQCADCGGKLVEHGEEMASVTELPEKVVLDVRAFRVKVCRCQACGKSVRGAHPDLAADQHGGTAHRLGPRLFAAAYLLHYVGGVTLRKIPAALEMLTGVKINQSTLTRDMLRRCKPAGCTPESHHASEDNLTDGSLTDGSLTDGSLVDIPSSEFAGGSIYQASQQIKVEIGSASMAHTDDTGWRIKGEGAFLMAFVNSTTAYFQIRQRHRNEEVREVISADFEGTMITDRGRSYDAQELQRLKQQKCLSHVLRSLDEVIEKIEARITRSKELADWSKASRSRQARSKVYSMEEAPEFCTTLKSNLQSAIALWSLYRKSAISEEEYRQKADELYAVVTYHLRPRELANLEEETLLDGLGKQHNRGHLLRFLKDPEVEPTNNRAERALRPAVIGRKVSQCSKSDRGADAYAAFMTVIQTLRLRQPTSLLTELVQVFATGTIPAA